ncbi:MAG: S-layer family protein, partial [Cyanobacteria bacterium J06573_2]
GREILFFGAAIEAITNGSSDGGKLTINSSESLKFDGIPAEFSASGIVGGKTNLLDTRTVSSGKGADIEINSPKVHIGGQSSIGSSGFDFGFIFSTNKILNQGNGGNITIRTNKFVNENGRVQTISQGDGNSGSITLIAKEAVLDGSKSNFRPLITSLNRDSGLAGDVIIIAERLSVNKGTIESSGFGAKGGNININVRNLELTNTGVISTSAYPSINNLQSQESAGNITINASESISISGHRFSPRSKRLFSSGLSSTSFTEGIPNAIVGDAGIIKVTTPHLKIFDGGEIAVNTFSSGNGGDIFIDADRIEISDSVIDDFGQRAGIKTTVEQGASGNGGHIDIKTNHLRVFDGGSIASDNVGISGDAGNVSINAGIIDIDGVLSEQQLPSTISAVSQNEASAGSVNITTDKINIRDRAEINVSNQGSGDSGNLNIAASNLFLDNNGSLKAEVNGGEKGNIKLNIDESLLLRRESLIESNATGTSEGGNITINSPVIAGFENSDIIANAVEGNGGNINITTQGIFGLEFSEQLTSESDITASSEFGINGTVDINNVNID